MSITCKWATCGEQCQAQFSNIEEMISHRMYDDFTFINMANLNSTSMPLILPRNLQILRFDNNKIFHLPPLPATLHSIFGKNNRLSHFPNISHCLELEDIDLNGNDIEELDCVIPVSVQTIDVSFTRLRYINYEKIPTNVRISASYCFLTQHPPISHKHNIVYDHNNIPDRVYNTTTMALNRTVGKAKVVPVPVLQVEWKAYERPLPAAAPIEPIVFQDRFAGLRPISIKTDEIIGTDSQSVHNSSVQQSANKSLDYVLKYVPRNPQPDDLITEVVREYKSKVINRSKFRKFLRGISLKWAESYIIVPPIREWCLRNDIHSVYGVTYKSLLKQVWAIIQDNEHKEAMKEVLFQEINDAIGVCFTGRFTRTLNALTGFIEQVQIGINSKEQMGNQITMAIKKAKEKLGNDFQSEARVNVKKILVEFEVPEAEHEAWLDAID